MQQEQRIAVITMRAHVRVPCDLSADEVADIQRRLAAYDLRGWLHDGVAHALGGIPEMDVEVTRHDRHPDDCADPGKTLKSYLAREAEGFPR